MQVIIIRHADAGDQDPKRYPDDDLRPLSLEGRHKQAAATRALQARGIGFDHLVTSPLLRAVQTARIVADGYGLEADPVVSDVLGHDCSPSTVVKLLERFPASSRVALVGHEPCLSVVAARMVASDEPLELKKSGVIGIGFDGPAKLRAGTLLYHLKPSKLKGLKG